MIYNSLLNLSLIVPWRRGSQYFDRLCNRWLVDHNWLESSLQGAVFLDVLAILSHGCGPNNYFTIHEKGDVVAYKTSITHL